LQDVSSNSVKVEYAPSKARINRELASYIRNLTEKRKIHLIVLFGSYAKNTYGWGSDVDLLIVSDDLPSDAGERFSLLTDPHFPVELQPFGYDLKEFERMLSGEHPLIVEALVNGEILHASPSMERRIHRLLKSHPRAS